MDHVEPSGTVVREAAKWLAQLESGDAGTADRRDFEAWRSAEPAHALAIERLGGIRARLADASEAERVTLRQLLLRPKRRAGGALPIILALAGAGWGGWQLPMVKLYLADEKTAAGETRVVALQDGSELTLSTASAVDMRVGEHARVVHLLQGEILARVEGKPLPFIVETDDGSAVALGTAFTVRKEEAATIVAVAESRVRICPARGSEAACMTLAAGERGRISHSAVERLADVPTADVGVWADGWLSADDRPLVEMIDELNRWRAAPIAFDRADLAGLSVSGVFPLGDTERAVANLVRLLPVRVDRSDPARPVMRRH